MRVILASTSPRRREILASLGIPFEVIAPQFDEQISPPAPIEDEVLGFALGKAQSVASGISGSIVIGSDTMISLDGRKIGKPSGVADARKILESLSGERHKIYTSVAIIDRSGGPGQCTIDIVEVRMRRLAPEEIDRYLETGESWDKAGAYSIQGEGRRLIEAVKGDYLAAVGLPLAPIASYLADRGIAIDHGWHKFYPMDAAIKRMG